MADADGFDVRSLAITLRQGATLPAHRHPWGQLLFARSGVMRVVTSDGVWLTPATKAIWVPAGLEHRIDIRGEVAMRTLYIAPERAEALAQAAATVQVEPFLRELILHIVHLGMLNPLHPEQDRIASVLIDRLRVARHEDLHLPLPRDPRALVVADRLRDTPDQSDLAALAKDSGASLRTLQRVFSRETGLTLEAWRQKARLIHAVAGLVSGVTVTTAAFNSGYQSVGAFISAFTRHFGVTPGRYAAQARQRG